MQLSMLDSISGFSERMRSIYIFSPILELSRKQKHSEYNLESLGFAILLFILEHMLHSTHDCTRETIAQFLKELILHSYQKSLTMEESLELARYLIAILRNDGIPFSYDYFDLEKAETANTKFSLLDYESEDGYHIKDKMVRLKLTTEGLDFLFKTREIYQELKISITQLYLKQQIAKGVFDGALRTVQELKLQVRDLKAEIDRMQEKIRCDVQKISKEGEYKKLVDRINRQLERERDVFLDIQKLIETTLQAHVRDLTTKREEQIIEKINNIKKELQKVVVEHDLLLAQKMDLGNLLIQSIDSSIIYAFRVKMNFDREILKPFVSGGGKPEFLKTLLTPLFFTRTPKMFNINKIFSAQDLISKKSRKEDDFKIDPQVEEEYILQELAKEKKLRLQEEEEMFDYLSKILYHISHNNSIELKTILEKIKNHSEENYLSIINKKHFYPTLIELHQMGEVLLRFRDELEFELVDLLPKVLTRIVEKEPEFREKINTFQLIVPDKLATPYLALENGYCITNFIFEKKEL